MTYNSIEDNFNSKESYLYNLALIIGEGRVLFACTDEDRHLLAMRGYKFEQEEDFISTASKTLTADTMLRQQYRSVKVAFSSQKFTLVPESLFSLSEVATYLQLIAPPDADEDVLYDFIPSIKAYLVYAVPRQLNTFVQEFFNRCSVFHSLTPLITAWSKASAHQTRAEVYAHVVNRQVSISVYDKERLLFCNVFPFKTAKDFLYWIMLVYDQLKLHPERIPLHVSGEIIADSEVFREAFKYVRQVNFLSLTPPYSIGENSSAVAPFYFFTDLFFLGICAS